MPQTVLVADRESSIRKLLRSALVKTFDLPGKIPLHRPVLRYGLAVATVLAVTAVRLGIAPLSGTAAPYATYYLATILTVSLAGRGPGIVAAILGGLAADYYFVEPRFAFGFWQGTNSVWAVLYLLASGTIIAAIDTQQTYRTRAQTALAELRRSHEQLEAAQNRAVTILESVSDGFNMFDRDCRYTYVNSAAAKMLGRTREELLGKKLWDLWPDAADSPFGRAYRRAIEENVPVRLEDFFPQLNAWFEIRCYPAAEGLSLFFTDTTERRHAEERLRQKQKLESIGLLAGGIAHDFNNILTVIMGSAGEALDECANCEHSRSIIAAAERAAYLTKQLLAYAGKGNFVSRLIDVSELVSSASELLRVSVPKRVTLSFELAENLPAVEADPSQMQQILMNLVINAGEAILPRHDGAIEIGTRACEITRETVPDDASGWEAVAGRYVCLWVRDNGTGMDQATLSRIFDPFFSTKFSGRGLGLAAIHGIVRVNRGFIKVRSQTGSGTTFEIFLPASEKVAAAKPPIETPRFLPAPHHPAATILVVDDEEIVRRLASVALRRCGYVVLEAANGKEALRVLAGAPSLPDVILLDQAMPVMGGDELIPILKARFPGVKILVTRGFAETETAMAGFLAKPYTGTELAEKIREVLEEDRKR